MCLRCAILCHIDIHTSGQSSPHSVSTYFIFWLCRVFVAVWAFSSCGEWRLLFLVLIMLLIAVAFLSLCLSLHPPPACFIFFFLIEG